MIEEKVGKAKGGGMAERVFIYELYTHHLVA